MPRASNRLPMVPKLSSAARIPFPGATSSWAVTSSFCTSITNLLSSNLTTKAPDRGPRPRDHSVLKAFLPSGPYELTLLLGRALLLGLLRPLFATPALFPRHPASFLFHLAVPVGVAHGRCLLSRVPFPHPVYPHTGGLNIAR